ncbi:MAG TPA: AbrB/MazE/SpoVT family DNA-binding domain-containing protein [Thermodesulfobacteriota bacterium]|nr:AbrB/MazE/SpoVT family DNA-binding domain-containing protein [Thermodesulfobacteriota bacterium]
MKTTIDSAGRLVTLKKIHQQAGIKPGMPLEVRWRDRRIEIEPAPLPVELVRKGHLLVAVPQKDVSPLTAETVKKTHLRNQLYDYNKDDSSG